MAVEVRGQRVVEEQMRVPSQLDAVDQARAHRRGRLTELRHLERLPLLELDPRPGPV
jgi:hypothetical protein